MLAGLDSHRLALAMTSALHLTFYFVPFCCYPQLFRFCTIEPEILSLVLVLIMVSGSLLPDSGLCKGYSDSPGSIAAAVKSCKVLAGRVPSKPTLTYLVMTVQGKLILFRAWPDLYLPNVL
jgi:hypothetical protein